MFHTIALNSAHITTRRRRSCDRCRSRRIRCDAISAQANSVCSACANANESCTFSLLLHRTQSRVYAKALERRLAELEQILHKLKVHSLANTEANDNEVEPEESLPGVRPAFLHEFVTKFVQSHSDNTHLGLEDTLVDCAEPEVVGHTLSQFLVRPLLLSESVKGALADMTCHTDSHPSSTPCHRDFQKWRRAEFWQAPPWERSIMADRPTTYNFPPVDLITSCTDLFFEKFNIFIPVLHRPTFIRAVQDGLYLRDEKFGAVVLLVCAQGSRFCNDPRALADGETSVLSNGWKWFNQIDLSRMTWISQPTLDDLHILCLSIFFIQTYSKPVFCWTLIGVALRLAQDLALRLGFPLKTGEAPTIESELWKRAWWALVCVDRVASMVMGRPCAIRSSEFQVPLPIECDDEYWETPDPTQAFKQPAGKPSIVSAFVQVIKLSNLTAMTLSSLYVFTPSVNGIERSRYQELFVNAIDSAINKWKESLPEHLRWSPNRKTDVFYDQSFFLLVYYYRLQVLVHQPFIPVPGRPSSSLSDISLVICTNAARSCCKTIRIYEERREPIHFTGGLTFTFAVVLLLYIWSSKSTGTPIDTVSQMAYVHYCLRRFEANEHWLVFARQLRDILMALAFVEEVEHNNKTSTQDVTPPMQAECDPEIYDSDPFLAQLHTMLESSDWSFLVGDQASISFSSPGFFSGYDE